jgi:hypothetical protein
MHSSGLRALETRVAAQDMEIARLGGSHEESIIRQTIYEVSGKILRYCQRVANLPELERGLSTRENRSNIRDTLLEIDVAIQRQIFGLGDHVDKSAVRRHVKRFLAASMTLLRRGPGQPIRRSMSPTALWTRPCLPARAQSYLAIPRPRKRPCESSWRFRPADAE